MLHVLCVYYVTPRDRVCTCMCVDVFQIVQLILVVSLVVLLNIFRHFSPVLKLATMPYARNLPRR